MTLVVPNHGEGDALLAIVAKTAAPAPILGLYTNNITPAETDTAATYTAATATGYAPITLTGASWTVTEGAPSDASFAQQTFTFTAAEATIYGYMVTRTTSGRIAWAERFTGAPFVIPAGGGTVKVTPILTAD